jgi:ABC-2 type transport system permease protein
MGMANMLAKENGAWWRTRRWWIQCLIWLILLNGMLALNIKGDIHPTAALEVFLAVAGFAVPIAAISMGQDSILGERDSGTAAWVLSKPLRRSVFILAKLIALGLGFLLTAVVLPGAIAYLQIRASGGLQFWGLGFAGAMGLVYLNLLFYLTLALMLATLLHGRGPVLGITLALLMGFQLFLKLAPWLAAVMPWRLLMSVGNGGPLVGYLVLRQTLPTVTPIIATVLWCALFVGVAIWRFRREEF